MMPPPGPVRHAVRSQHGRAGIATEAKHAHRVPLRASAMKARTTHTRADGPHLVARTEALILVDLNQRWDGASALGCGAVLQPRLDLRAQLCEHAKGDEGTTNHVKRCVERRSC